MSVAISKACLLFPAFMTGVWLNQESLHQAHVQRSGIPTLAGMAVHGTFEAAFSVIEFLFIGIYL